MLNEQLLWFGIDSATPIPSWYHLLLLMLDEPVLRYGCDTSLRAGLAARARVVNMSLLACIMMVISAPGCDSVLSGGPCLVWRLHAAHVGAVGFGHDLNRVLGWVAA